MPIAQHLKKYYATPEWKAAKVRILRRAGGKCESCGKPRGEHVYTVTRPAEGTMFWSLGYSRRANWYDRHGLPVPFPAGPSRRILVKVGIAHLDHDPTNNADSNLRALCDFCHLKFDAPFHKYSRSLRRDKSRPIIVALQEAV